ncbi:MAG: hypothetical protein A3C90_00780 [Candidatus Magasanikbacteria bacterium RIFCSPHIGHO2_02_FULL_51_14]|uniref:Cell shape determination protein CcmA n=1 Tax=Candidatus Magasanikbacteria bacterium RIFCSPHIGHO2_02_FULL_51_14 TaxID=1798683 RepID=A0A1F6MQ87_9BACT|nr:MAG: hypothetical protein A3C90_00780 [Candidatus Magasanikbacteria bacterium RIFCSPHIGHO2_02_FULL_51_14]
MFQKPSPVISLSHTEERKDTVHDDVETVVGPSVSVEGDFSSEGNIVVKGSVSGNVKTSKLLTVEKGAKILANVKAGSALISGQVRGGMRVNDRLELTETAQVEGDVSCKILVVAAGALVHGKVMMKGITIEAPKTEKKSFIGRSKEKPLTDLEEEKII